MALREEGVLEQLAVSTAGVSSAAGLSMNAFVSNQPAHTHSTPLTCSRRVPLQGAAGADAHHDSRA